MVKVTTIGARVHQPWRDRYVAKERRLGPFWSYWSSIHAWGVGLRTSGWYASLTNLGASRKLYLSLSVERREPPEPRWPSP